MTQPSAGSALCSSLVPALTFESFFSGNSTGAAWHKISGLWFTLSNTGIKLVDIASGNVLGEIGNELEAAEKTSTAKNLALPSEKNKLEEILKFVLTPDGNFLITAGRSHLMRRWRLDGIESFKSGDSNGDDSATAAGETPGRFKAVQEQSWKGPEAPASSMDIAVVLEQTLVAVGSSKGHVKIYDAMLGVCTHTFPLVHHRITAIGFHFQETLLFAGEEDGTLRVLDLVEHKCNGVMKDHMSAITDLKLVSLKSQDADQQQQNRGILVSAGRDQIINFWHLDRILAAKEKKNVSSPFQQIIAFDNLESILVLQTSLMTEVFIEGTCLHSICPWVVAAAGSDAKIRLFNPTDRKLLKEISTFQRDSCSIVRLLGPIEEVDGMAHEGQVFAALGEDSLLSFYSLKTLECIHTMIGHHAEILGCKFLPSGFHDSASTSVPHFRDGGAEICRMLLLSGDVTARVMTVIEKPPAVARGGRIRASVHFSVLRGHSENIIASDSDGSGCWLMTGARDETARIWSMRDAMKPTTVAIIRGHAGHVSSVALSKKKSKTCVCGGDPTAMPRVLLAATGSSDGSMKLWKLKENEMREVTASDRGDDEELRAGKKKTKRRKLETDGMPVDVATSDWNVNAHSKEITSLIFFTKRQMHRFDVFGSQSQNMGCVWWFCTGRLPTPSRSFECRIFFGGAGCGYRMSRHVR